MDVITTGWVVCVVQVLTGGASAYAAKKAADAANDLLAEVTVGKGTVKFDTSDILAVAFGIFVLWAVANTKLEAREALAAFTVVLTGTGIKEVLHALLPLKRN
jgi:hypothetical protein